jgi:N-acetylgalactosamine kinase
MENLVVDSFRKEFGEQPSFIVRAPGRVNLIGEHIDYSGYGVLPMAVEQSVFCAVKINPDNHQLILHNVDPKYEKYVGECFRVTDEQSGCGDQKNSAPKWHEYFLCGIRGLSEHLGTSPSKPLHSVGMKIMIGGNIPPSAGLSSSSAMVCAGAICTLKSNTNSDFEKVDRFKVAEMCAKCERYIGTEGGGMDQAICLLAQAGEAKLIEFNPLRTKSVTLPQGAAFVVANCCRDMNKAASPKYNERVVECRIAAQILAKTLGFDWSTIRTLGQLQTRADKPLKDLLDLVDKYLPMAIYSREDVCRLLDITSDELEAKSLSPNTLGLKEFKLKQRAMHVYSEAGRVYEFEKVCRSSTGDNALRELGRLMDDSHESCRDWFECSCSELDDLQVEAKKAGALGCRLTGAGWGGCTVSLVREADTKDFVEKLRKSYFASVDLKQYPFEKAVFSTVPSVGAEIKLCKR